VLGRTEPRVPLAEIRSFEAMLPKSTDWRTYGNGPAAVPERGRVA
jgi:hypothetical protein